MNNINFSQKRESDQDESFQETDEEYYENYRRKSLPEGYTAYKDTRQVNDVVYDRYNSVYSTSERPDTGRKSCCKIGRLLNVSKLLKSSVRVDILHHRIDKKPFQRIHRRRK